MAEQASTAQRPTGTKDPLPSTREKSPPGSAFTGKPFTLIVGTGKKKRTFYAHHELLCFYSGYFRAALNGNFAEAHNGVVTLDEEPDVFELFIKWLYTHKAHTEDITRENCRDLYTSSAKLWILADRRDIPLLMNDMIDYMRQILLDVWIVPLHALEDIYENTTEGSRLRRFVVDMFVKLANETAFRRYNPDTKPNRFHFDVAETMFQKREQQGLSKKAYGQLDLCADFHAHEPGVRCPKRGTKRSHEEVGK